MSTQVAVWDNVQCGYKAVSTQEAVWDNVQCQCRGVYIQETVQEMSNVNIKECLPRKQYGIISNEVRKWCVLPEVGSSFPMWI